MVNQESFRSFYNSELHPLLVKTEKDRKSVAQFAYIFYASIAVAVIIVLLIFSGGGDANFAIIIPIAIVGIIGWVYSNKKERFANEFKQLIISKIVQFVSPGCQYSPTQHISENDYNNSNLHRRKYDRFNGEDYFEGRHGKTSFYCSELHTEYKTSDSKGRTSWHTIFRGLFFVADFNKHFSGRTYVWADGHAEVSTTMIGRMFSSFSQELERVKLEDPEFEQFFDVFSTDQVESRYLLSPSLIQRMVNLRIKMDCRMECSFADSKLYMSFPVNNNLFEPGIHNANDNFETAWGYVTEFALFFDIIDELNLNNRIWTKN